MDLKEIMGKFKIDSSVELYGNGHINDTYLCGMAPRYILQRINHNVFKSPEQVMENIYHVTEHVRKKIIAGGGNPERETLTVVPTKDGNIFYKSEDGNYFRMYRPCVFWNARFYFLILFIIVIQSPIFAR